MHERALLRWQHNCRNTTEYLNDTCICSVTTAPHVAKHNLSNSICLTLLDRPGRPGECMILKELVVAAGSEQTDWDGSCPPNTDHKIAKCGQPLKPRGRLANQAQA